MDMVFAPAGTAVRLDGMVATLGRLGTARKYSDGSHRHCTSPLMLNISKKYIFDHSPVGW